VGAVAIGATMSYVLGSPMPLLMAFGFGAIVAIQLEDEEL
jgi:NhaP-type Na+/H+ or K+/H+ antiporter